MLLANSVLALFLVASGVNAFQVTFPTGTQGWTNSGSQTLTWDRVNTDATNFTVVLTNEDRSVLPTNNVVLAEFVDASSASSTSVSAPSSGWPTGGSFRVNFVKDKNNLNTIYAQSSEFNITAGSSTASAGVTVSSASRTGSTLVITPTSAAASASGTDTATSGSASTTPNSAEMNSMVSMTGLSFVILALGFGIF